MSHINILLPPFYDHEHSKIQEFPSTPTSLQLHSPKILPIENVGRVLMQRQKVSENEQSWLNILKESSSHTKQSSAPIPTLIENEIEDKEESIPLDVLHADPKDWKNLDLYAILGLSSKRWKANENDIRKAYRARVLKHHPDKLAAQSGDPNADAFFKCIQKAHEVITHPIKRRQFDSVDPTFDESIPPPKLKGNFFKVYGTVFERNARFSKEEDVPTLGDMKTSREDVEHFYNVWSSFDSWRTFEWKDEKDAEGVDGRDEKRHIEKQNKAARQKLKREDNARILRLVDQAVRLDPRLIQFKEMDKLNKEKKKRERESQLENKNKKQQEELLVEKKKVEEEQFIDKEKVEMERKEKEARKKLAKKYKKSLKTLFKDYNYFLKDPNENLTALTHQLELFDSIVEQRAPESLEKMLQMWQKSETEAKNWWEREAKGENKEIEVSAVPKSTIHKDDNNTNLEKVPNKAQRDWTGEELKCLVEAIKKFPGGTSDRWNVIAGHIAQHTHCSLRDGHDVINQSKQLSSMTPDQISSLIKEPSIRKKNDHMRLKEEPSQRNSINTDVQLSTSSTLDDVENAELKQLILAMGSPWTSVEQQQLEAAMRSFPTSKFKGNSRWERVAGKLKGRSLDQVKARVKYLQDQVKSKKAQK